MDEPTHSAGGDAGAAPPADARSRGRPRLREAAAIDAAIRAAALDMLLEHGEAATLNAVAQAAGLSRKSVYARFSNKADLFISVIRDDLLQDKQPVEYSTTGTAEDRLASYVEAAFLLVNAPKARAIQRLLAVNPNYIAALKVQMHKATRRHFFEPLIALLEEARRTGALAIVDVEATATVIITLIFAETVHRSHEDAFFPPRRTLTEQARFITELMLRGLRPRAE
ncbi:TetR/AcrR family transcriptional regulator [Sphingobium sufflavum]|uniref:TetR/AcrR family transcriptional regulator n=1 Tax=Sphingobium sufflavum TaxID=1129547 RepID=UPI001F40D489|nr:TetR/AcrR family transcriptional regulator [Sphingobium sufflavum]MCE7796223.1 TetR/AcrR family transcriptional regulator [Sphingobium sufflavum]